MSDIAERAITILGAVRTDGKLRRRARRTNSGLGLGGYAIDSGDASEPATRQPFGDVPQLVLATPLHQARAAEHRIDGGPQRLRTIDREQAPALRLDSSPHRVLEQILRPRPDVRRCPKSGLVRRNRGWTRVRGACQVSDRRRVRGRGRCGSRKIFSSCLSPCCSS